MRQGKRVLLLGAGFSRNWGGWLANEALEYLLGCPQIDDGLRTLLVRNKAKGFEETLGYLQAQADGRPSEALRRLEGALREMFRDMNAAFGKRKRLAFGNDSQSGSISDFLRRFDAIFTLNQDTLLEMHYLNDVAVPAGDRYWQGGCLPGMERVGDHKGEWTAIWQPASHVEELPANLQPYIKLHGSSNWRTADDGQLLIMGTKKSATIARVPILKWGFQQFSECLAGDGTSLMVIGYSFGDKHVNDILLKSAEKRTIRLFVVDPLGMDVMDKYRDAQIPGPSALKDALWGVLFGCSRRPLAMTFGGDVVEYAKLMRFISQ